MTDFNYVQTVAQLKAASALQAQMAAALEAAYKAGYQRAEMDGKNPSSFGPVNDEAKGYAYDDGYEEGYAEGFEDGDEYNGNTVEAYNDGYCAGVNDARLDPTTADIVIENIIAYEARAAEAEAFGEEPRVHQHLEGEDLAEGWDRDDEDLYKVYP
jgi:hypothetical protein